jgi:tetratricopeptide (TPR) repeat protein
MDAGAFMHAAGLMEAHLKTHPDDVEVRPLMAEALLKSGQNVQAEYAVDDLIRLAPLHSRGLWLKSILVRLRGGEHPEFFLRKAAESPLPDPDALGAYGQYLLMQDQPEEARRVLKRSAEAGSTDYRVPAMLGGIAFQEGQFAEAENWFVRAIQLEKTDAPLWIMLSDAQKNNGHPEKAVESLSEALKHCRERGPLYLKYGDALWMAGRKPEAVTAFEQAMNYPSVKAQAALKAARSYYILGQYDEANQTIALAAEQTPDDPQVIEWKEKIENALWGKDTTSPPDTTFRLR